MDGGESSKILQVTNQSDPFSHSRGSTRGPSKIYLWRLLMDGLTQKFTLENNKASDLTVIIEPWAEEIIVFPGKQ
jgi:hypothetical protein